MTSIETEIKDIVNHIKGKYKYTNFIKQIVFNNYANIKPNERINFSFPLTVLIGMNGCNKTRVLQALYGIPAGNSVGDFWFSTPLDPINYKKKPRYTYFYSDNKNSEILYPVVYNKASGKSKGDDPDYWETTKLTGDLAKKYPKDRYSPIEKECLYIDSKIELSAYDICFNFNGRDTGKKLIIKKIRNLFVLNLLI